MRAYPATLEPDPEGGVAAHFEGLPGATWGATEQEALKRARDLLASALEMLLEDGEAPPTPPPADGRPVVEAEVDFGGVA